MFGECHGHMVMNGVNYREAVNAHKDGVNESIVRSWLAHYQQLGISFFRDGGDALGVSLRASRIAQEYGIDYRTPVFAIHKKGYYGHIVGKGFQDIREYRGLVDEAGKNGADFIKLMLSGILDFNCFGKISDEPLDANEVKEWVHIAHEEGFSVMAHVNGSLQIKNALLAGIDSLEHGYYMDGECFEILKESHAVWVPSLAPIGNLRGSGRFNENAVNEILNCQLENIRTAVSKEIPLALGSDAGAVLVPHGEGLLDEYHYFETILPDAAMRDVLLKDGEKMIANKFKRV